MKTTDYCWSIGPRIGGEGTPICFRPSGHLGSHESHPDSGFREQWSGLGRVVPECNRQDWWQPVREMEQRQ